MKRRLIATAAILMTSAGSAQEVYYWPAAPSAAQASRMTQLPMGTPLTLVTRTEVNTKQAKPGDRVHLEVAESLSYRGQIVVPVGSPAVAEVVRSERNGHFGKKGAIEFRLLYVQTPSGPVRLTGRAERYGKSVTGWSIAGAALVAWPLMFIHGTSGYIRQGTIVPSYFAEPMLFAAVSPSFERSATMQSDAGALPARFDPRAFGGSGSMTAVR